MSLDLEHSIVVVGNMNPAIHNPHWYRSLDAIDDVELQKAVARPDIVVTQQLSRFAVGPIQVQCLPPQWKATVERREDEPRVLALAVRAFGALEQTPVRAFGMNYTGTRTIRAGLPSLLGSRVGGVVLPKSLDGSDAQFETLTLVYPLPDLHEASGYRAERRLRSQLTLLMRPAAIAQVAVNVHHQILKGTEPTFDLPDLLEQAATVRDTVEAHILNVLDSLESAGA